MAKGKSKKEIFEQIKSLLNLDECTSIKTITVRTIREEDINVDPVDIGPVKKSSSNKSDKKLKTPNTQSVPQNVKDALSELRKRKKEGKLIPKQTLELKKIGSGYLTKAKKEWILTTHKELSG